MPSDPASIFQDVTVSATGTQLLHHRFPNSRPLDDDLPRVSSWRCNLTALSHDYNLFFVAHGSQLYVHMPQFPTQSLTQEPALIIDTLPSRPDLRGYLDPRHPHDINNIVVQRLGHDEVVAVVRDDGDVDAYLTRHVTQAIERRAQPNHSVGLVAADLRPFFHRNVGISAWGLAIHSQARMIAVSSNLLQVTVFTFALVDAEDLELDSMEEEQVYESDKPYRKPPADRKKNDTRIIKNGRANIPNITFCNTGHDPTGKWLLSTDISGVVRSWNVHDLTPGELVRATTQPSRVYVGSFDTQNAGWSLLCLDPNSFRPANSLRVALGLPALEEAEFETASPMWDVSSTVTALPDNAPRLKFRPPLDILDGNYSNPVLVEQIRSRNPPRDQARGLRSRRSGVWQSNLRRSRAELEAAMDVDDPDDDETEDDSQDLMLPEYDVDTIMANLEAIRAEAVSSPLSDDDDDAFDQYFYQELSPYMPRAIFKPQILFQGDKALCGSLPCPILHASVHTLYLFQPSASNSAHEHQPLIAAADIFRQRLPLNDSSLAPTERCNMSASIPSLGVVVIATQKGRAAVLSLTQVVADAPCHLTPSGLKEKVVYGFRIECILPRAEQEAAGHRPNVPLHGIAVGPVQGTEGCDEDQRRWRLLMMWQDRSVLSYEISRGSDEALGIAQVMV